MLKRRGKGPPKKGQGKQAAKRKKKWYLLVLMELDRVILWIIRLLVGGLFVNTSKNFGDSDLIIWHSFILSSGLCMICAMNLSFFRIWVIWIADFLCALGTFPELFLPESRFQESIHFLLNNRHFTLVVVVNCEQHTYELSSCSFFTCICALHAYVCLRFALASLSSTADMLCLLIEKTANKITGTFFYPSFS
jgi:hypothetical protein